MQRTWRSGPGRVRAWPPDTTPSRRFSGRREARVVRLSLFRLADAAGRYSGIGSRIVPMPGVNSGSIGLGSGTVGIGAQGDIRIVVSRRLRIVGRPRVPWVHVVVIVR